MTRTPPNIPPSSKRTSSLHRSDTASSQSQMSGPSNPPARPRRRKPVVREDYGSAEEENAVEKWTDLSAISPVPRSRVSMDAIEDTGVESSTKEFDSMRPALHVGDSEPSGSSRNTVKQRQVRISVPAPLEISDSGATSSKQGRTTGHQHELENAEIEIDQEGEGQRTPTLADVNLRSTPGVQGIGEGWAGGPQRQYRSSWWKRRKPQDDTEDPLSLWSSPRVGDRPEVVSPAKSFWNRSLQRLGGSMPHLLIDDSPMETRPTSSMPKSPPSDPTSWSPLPAVFVYGTNTGSATGARSTPHLGAPLEDRVDRSSSQPISSTPSKSGTSNSHLPLDSMPTATLDTRRFSGPRPPWRPSSTASPSALTSVGPSRPKAIYEVAELDIASEITTDIGKDQMDRPTTSAPTAQPAVVVTLERTDTFGATASKAGGARIPADEIATPKAKGIRDRYRESTIGFDSLHQLGSETETKPTSPGRRSSIFDRIRIALTPPRSSSKTAQSPSPLRMFAKTTPSSPAQPKEPLNSSNKPPVLPRTASDSACLVTQNTVKEGLDDPAPAPRSRTSLSMRHKRRKSWIGSSDNWAKRLGRLPESGEEQETVTPDEVQDKPVRRNSFIFRVLPTKSTSSLHPSDLGSRISALPSANTSLVRMSTTDLDLHLDLPETGLGLDDILVDHKRRTLLDSYDLSPPHHLFSSSASSALSETASTSTTPTTNSRSTHSRMISVPATICSISTGSGSSNFPETPRMANAQAFPVNPAVRKQKSDASMASCDDMSFYSAREIPDGGYEHGYSLDKAESRLSTNSELGTSETLHEDIING